MAGGRYISGVEVRYDDLGVGRDEPVTLRNAGLDPLGGQGGCGVEGRLCAAMTPWAFAATRQDFVSKNP